MSWRRVLPLGLVLAGCVPESAPAILDAAVPPNAASAIADAGAVTDAPDASMSVDAATLAADAGAPISDAGALAPDAAPLPVRPRGPLWRVTADRRELSALALTEAELDAEGRVVITAGGGTMAMDPFGRGNYHGGSYYNGGSYRYAVAASETIEWPVPFDEVVPSFEVDTPPGTWINVKVAARVAGRWTQDYVLGVWAYDDGTVRRHSVDDQDDGDARVLTDTLRLARPADALRVTAVLFSATSATPRLRALSAVAIDTTRAPAAEPADRAVWGTVLRVPMRSQMIYPDGGEVWCSPTSLTMLLAYWSQELGEPSLLQTVPRTASMTFDWIYDGNGNWPFNTAHAAAAGGGVLHGFVTRLGSMAQLERLIAAGVPVSISVSYGRGELSRSPIGSTAGHLIVVKGFDARGDVVVNDPAFGADRDVEVTYDRAELERAWSHSERTTYVIHPRARPLPADPRGAF